jgi:hypothetical protein
MTSVLYLPTSVLALLKDRHPPVPFVQKNNVLKKEYSRDPFGASSERSPLHTHLTLLLSPYSIIFFGDHLFVRRFHR